jgi:Pentapeptide repeats (8 copies)
MRLTPMAVFYKKESDRPKPWREYRQRFHRGVARPFLYVEWLAEWAAWFLGRWAVLEVLEYCGTLGIVVGVIFYFTGAGDRLKQKHYQAWQVINTAQGKGGNGGRTDALEDLLADGVSLVGVDVSGASIQRIKLPRANLHRANLSGADMRGADLSWANLQDTNMIYTNLRGSSLRSVRLDGVTDMTNADLTGADLTGADLGGQVVLDQADLRGADLNGIKNWQSIESIKLANILGCKNPPEGFVKWAVAGGAVQIASDEQWAAVIRASTRPSAASVK